MQQSLSVDTQKELRVFLYRLCVEFGVCLPPSKKEEIVSRDFFQAEDSVSEVLFAEGLDPRKELYLFRQIKREFTDRFGGEIGKHWMS